MQIWSSDKQNWLVLGLFAIILSGPIQTHWIYHVKIFLCDPHGHRSWKCTALYSLLFTKMSSIFLIFTHSSLFSKYLKTIYKIILSRILSGVSMCNWSFTEYRLYQYKDNTFPFSNLLFVFHSPRFLKDNWHLSNTFISWWPLFSGTWVTWVGRSLFI